jgi:subtilisin-like proprotein convertase family protein
MSRLGYNPGAPSDGDLAGNYTNDFGGTSSACPGAAGVAALMLSVNPELSAAAVKERMAKACERIDPTGGLYDARGHSVLYGFGRLNAERAVQLARDEARDVTLVSKVFNRRIADLQTIEAELDVAEAQPLRGLTVNVEIQHTWIGDLVVTLVPPAASGIPSIKLHDRAGGSTRDLRRSFDAATTPALAQAVGRSASGRWLLRIQDAAREDEGQLIKFGLELRLGSAPVRALDASAPAPRPS